MATAATCKGCGRTFVLDDGDRRGPFKCDKCGATVAAPGPDDLRVELARIAHDVRTIRYRAGYVVLLLAAIALALLVMIFR